MWRHAASAEVSASPSRSLLLRLPLLNACHATPGIDDRDSLDCRHVTKVRQPYGPSDISRCNSRGRVAPPRKESDVVLRRDVPFLRLLIPPATEILGQLNVVVGHIEVQPEVVSAAFVRMALLFDFTFVE